MARSPHWRFQGYRLARQFSVQGGFELSQQPVPQTVEVWIDGVLVASGWMYDVASNAVVFDAAATPPGGSTIEVTYAVLPDGEG